MKFLYEGKAKTIYSTDNPNEVLISFKDDATAFNGEKKDSIKDKGRVNLAFTRYFFEMLQQKGIKTHIVKFVDDKTLLAKKVDIIPIEVVVRNFTAGSICKRTGIEKGKKLDPVICQFFLKDDSLGDPLITEDEALNLELANQNELDQLRQMALTINEIIFEAMQKFDVTLVDFKLEFGKTPDGQIILADEISPDTCRFWKKGTMESLDKDVFRESKGDLVESYKKLADLVGVKL